MPTQVDGSSDESGMAVFEMSWSTTTPLEAIERALYAMADQVSGVTSAVGDTWLVTLHPRSKDARADGLAHQMRQQVIDQTLRIRIAERTDPIRNLVFALAFSRSGLAAAASPDGADSSTATLL